MHVVLIAGLKEAEQKISRLKGEPDKANSAATPTISSLKSFVLVPVPVEVVLVERSGCCNVPPAWVPSDLDVSSGR